MNPLFLGLIELMSLRTVSWSSSTQPDPALVAPNLIWNPLRMEMLLAHRVWQISVSVLLYPILTGLHSGTASDPQGEYVWAGKFEWLAVAGSSQFLKRYLQ